MTEDWMKEWERRIVNGVYPLRRFLGRSNHSVVFLTECKAQNVAQAAIKILPAYPALIEAHLAHWRTIATLSHPHLIRLLDSGRCQLGGHTFLFVVMELAEQTLAQILPSRPLTSDEVREMLAPTLDALAYLHGKNLVQGGLKPHNFLVIGDRLVLASDTIRPAGEPRAPHAKLSLYDPPEAKSSTISATADIWGLGITLAEALTQTPPAWSRATADTVSLPPDLAPEFVDTLQRCLNRDPGRRPELAEIAAQLIHAPATSPVLSAPSAVGEPVAQSPSTQKTSSRTRLLVIAIAGSVIVLWSAWAALRKSHPPSTLQLPVSLAPSPQPSVPPPAAAENVEVTRDALPTILHQDVPDVSRRARESIQGVIEVVVRVTIDRSGNVVATALDSRGSSRSFARAATKAAKKWKFAPAADHVARTWLLNFEFARSGVTVHAAAVGP